MQFGLQISSYFPGLREPLDAVLNAARELDETSFDSASISDEGGWRSPSSNPRSPVCNATGGRPLRSGETLEPNPHLRRLQQAKTGLVIRGHHASSGRT